MGSVTELLNKYFFYCEYKTIHSAIEKYTRDHYEVYQDSNTVKIDLNIMKIMEEWMFQIQAVYIEELHDDNFVFRVIVSNILTASRSYPEVSLVYQADFELTYLGHFSEQKLSTNFRIIRPYTKEMFAADIKKQHYKPLYIQEKLLDKEAEKFLKKYYPEALEAPMSIQDDILLHRMGLTRYYAPLEANTLGRVYLQDSWKATAYRVFSNQDIYSENFDEDDYKYIRISENTILVDPRGKLLNNPGAQLFTTIHECVHWEKHRNYFRLRYEMEKATEMFINEIKYLPENLKQKGYTQKEIDKLREMLLQENNYEYYGEYHKKKYCQEKGIAYKTIAGFYESFSLMEWQANALAAHILMPSVTAKTKLQKLLDELIQQDEDERQAVILQKAVMALAEIYNVSKQVVKNRVIELGYKTAIGVLNYIDGEYIEPFSFVPEALGRNQTYCLTEASLNEELQRNQKLRELFDENEVVYVNKMCVVNSPLYILDDNGTQKMTAYALNHVDQCCFLFDVKKEQFNIDNHEGDSYNFINHDWELNRYLEAKLDLSKAHNVSTVTNAEESGKLMRLIDEYLAVLDDLPGSLGGELKAHIERKAKEIGKENIPNVQLADMTYLDNSEIGKILNNQQRNPDVRTLLALCKGLKLHPFFIIHILDTAGKDIFTASRENLFYIYLIFYHHEESVDEWADKMRAAGIHDFFPPGEKKQVEKASKKSKKQKNKAKV